MALTRDDVEERRLVALRLIAWRESTEKRNDDMRRARQLGMSVIEIAELTGLVRQHVSGILHGTR